jgi:hypothetical protein
MNHIHNSTPGHPHNSDTSTQSPPQVRKEVSTRSPPQHWHIHPDTPKSVTHPPGHRENGDTVTFTWTPSQQISDTSPRSDQPHNRLFLSKWLSIFQHPALWDWVDTRVGRVTQILVSDTLFSGLLNGVPIFWKSPRHLETPLLYLLRNQNIWCQVSVDKDLYK